MARLDCNDPVAAHGAFEKGRIIYRVIIFIIRSYAHQIKHIAEKGLEVYPMSSISISLQSCLCTSAENDSELTRAQLGPRGHGMH